jgi:hypothetical protein
MANLEPLLSRLRVLLPADSPSDLWIRLDGVTLSPAALETGIPVDPGVHHLSYGAPKRLSATVEVRVTRAGPFDIALPELRRAPGEHPPASHTVPTGSSTRWLLAGIGLGLGAGAITSGAYFGVRAKQEWDERNERCREGCDEAAVAAGHDAEGFARAANVALAAGLAVTAAGSYFLITAITTQSPQQGLSGGVDPGGGASLTWTQAF